MQDVKIKNYITLMDDFVIKSLWLQGSPKIKNVLKKVFGELAHINTDEFVPYAQELGGISNSDLRRRVDILYISKDKTQCLNVEINRYPVSSRKNRNNAYAFSIEGSIYGKDENVKSKDAYKVLKQTIQVNLNLYKNDYEYQRPKVIMLTDQETLETEEDIIIYRYYLPNYKEKCYNDIGREPIEIKFLAMLNAESYEELERIVNTEKELEPIMDDFKRFENGNLSIMSEWEYNALHDSEQSELQDIARAEGLAEGEMKGKLETAKKMLEKSLDIELISEITGLSTEEINSLKN